VTTKIDQVLQDAELVCGVLAGAGGLINPAVPAGAELLAKLLSMVSAGVAAHEAISGQALDLTKLHHLDPVA